MQLSMLLVSNLMKLSLPPGRAAGSDRRLSRVEWMAEAEAEASCGEPRMAVGVSVPDAMGWSSWEGGVRKPDAAAPLADGWRDLKLEVLVFGESVLGVEEDAAGGARGAVRLDGEESVGDDGMDSPERERVKYTTFASDPPTSMAIWDTASIWLGR